MWSVSSISLTERSLVRTPGVATTIFMASSVAITCTDDQSSLTIGPSVAHDFFSQEPALPHARALHARQRRHDAKRITP